MPKTIQIDKLRYNLIDPLCQFFLLYNLEIIAYKAKMGMLQITGVSSKRPQWKKTAVEKGYGDKDYSI